MDDGVDRRVRGGHFDRLDGMAQMFDDGVAQPVLLDPERICDSVPTAHHVADELCALRTQVLEVERLRITVEVTRDVDQIYRLLVNLDLAPVDEALDETP